MIETITNLVVLLVILLVSVIIHENAHGWTALALGDPTARNAGRLTLNPVPHLDPVGSFILPAFLAVASQGAFTFGYAKPVPISPQKLKGTDRAGFAIVALAGPVSNVVLAFVAALFAGRFYGIEQSILEEIVLGGFGITGGGFGVQLVVLFFTVNIFLAAFNLVPVPPLDGSRLLRPFLGDRGVQILDKIEPYGFLIILLLITVLSTAFYQVVFFIAELILSIDDVILRILPG